MRCSSCGRPIEPPDAVCRCTPVSYVLNAEPGEMRITGHPVGMVVEGPLDSEDGRRVDCRPASGGRAFSDSDGTGSFSAELSAPLDRGRPAEGHAVGVLVKALRDRGDEVE